MVSKRVTPHLNASRPQVLHITQYNLSTCLAYKLATREVDCWECEVYLRIYKGLGLHSLEIGFGCDAQIILSKKYRSNLEFMEWDLRIAHTRTLQESCNAKETEFPPWRTAGKIRPPIKLQNKNVAAESPITPYVKCPDTWLIKANQFKILVQPF